MTGWLPLGTPMMQINHARESAFPCEIGVVLVKEIKQRCGRIMYRWGRRARVVGAGRWEGGRIGGLKIED